jgi:hypothetical protein
MANYAKAKQNNSSKKSLKHQPKISGVVIKRFSKINQENKDACSSTLKVGPGSSSKNQFKISSFLRSPELNLSSRNAQQQLMKDH